MWQKGRVFILAFMLFLRILHYWIDAISNREKFSVCPSKQQLQDYCTVMTGYGGLCCFVCGCVCSGCSRTKVQWVCSTLLHSEICTNCVGSVFVIQSIKNICSESANSFPIAIAVFIWGWFTVLMVLSC